MDQEHVRKKSGLHDIRYWSRYRYLAEDRILCWELGKLLLLIFRFF